MEAVEASRIDIEEEEDKARNRAKNRGGDGTR
jgi:hypothetical protein